MIQNIKKWLTMLLLTLILLAWGVYQIQASGLHTSKLQQNNTLIIGTESIQAGNNGSIDVFLDNADAVASVQLEISYNRNSGITFTGVNTTERTSGFDTFFNESMSGSTINVTILIYNLSSLTIAAGNESILKLDFTTNEEVGTTTLIIDDVLLSNSSGDALSVSGIDGSITINSVVTPNPTTTNSPTPTYVYTPTPFPVRLSIPTQSPIVGDISGDGNITPWDVVMIAQLADTCQGMDTYNNKGDINGDGCITEQDAVIVAEYSIRIGPMPTATPTPTFVSIPFTMLGDTNRDRQVDIQDFVTLSRTYLTCQGMDSYYSGADLNEDGCVDDIDFSIFENNFDSLTSNDNCSLATLIQPKNTSLTYTFQHANDNDWLTFIAPSNGIYEVEVHVPDNSNADVDLAYFTACDTDTVDTWRAAFAPGVKLDIAAQAGQQFYLQLTNADGNVFGPDVTYQVSIRKLSDERPTGATIILAGRLRANDELQTNINRIAQKVHGVFRSKGVHEDDILFLSTDPELTGHDNMATVANLQTGITQWARERVNSQQALTLDLIDHGERDIFYIDDVNGEYMTTNELDTWLNELETAVPDLLTNVIVEACHSGSFIDRLNSSISKPNRLIITSTSVESDAYTSISGIQFSDAFITQLHQGNHFATAYWRAKAYAQIISPYQEPWLDGNGDGTPGEPEDIYVAGLRGLDYADPARTRNDSRIKWPPYIADAQPPIIMNQYGNFQVEVRDDRGVEDVWAVIYPPNYEPNGILNEFGVPERISLQPRTDLGENIYDGGYRGFRQAGEYRVIIQAIDIDGLIAQPVVFTLDVTNEMIGEATQRTFLPMVSR
ncbi:MAG: dockerin type I domain-containing protein [Chloroflexota bacterium]